MRIIAAERPYLITFHSSGHTYPLTHEEAQRILDREHAVRRTGFVVVLAETNTDDPSRRATLRPATLGGGLAFSTGKM